MTIVEIETMIKAIKQGRYRTTYYPEQDYYTTKDEIHTVEDFKAINKYLGYDLIYIG